MAIQWRLLSEIKGYEWVEGYRIGYDPDDTESGFRLQSRRRRVYAKGRGGASGSSDGEWHDLKLSVGSGGYLQTNVYTGGRKRTVQLHRVGLLAFGPPQPPGGRYWVLHRDDDKSRNTLDNLYWGMAKQNADDRKRNGLTKVLTGEGLPQSKLTVELAREIYRRSSSGESPTSIARDFGISQANVSMIKHKKAWKHIHTENVVAPP